MINVTSKGVCEWLEGFKIEKRKQRKQNAKI